MAATRFDGASAIVTGAASGIGLALAKGLVARGARVWLTDIDAEGAAKEASVLGSNVQAATLDVRDAAAFEEIVARVVDEHGRLDLLFNNAGIGVAGEAHELDAEHFQRTIDINIRGVTNGVAAAYPRMVAQGQGHLVNVASAAGLVPTPLLAAYGMSKHAVVGLSRSLRLEAERYRVHVTALCPTAIETPLLDGGHGLEKPPWPDLRRYLTAIAGPPFDVDRFAQVALDGVAANRSLVIAPASGRVAALLFRLLPGVGEWSIRRALAGERAERP